MQVQLETLSNLERRMNIALPLAAIDAQVAERLKRVARNAKIQGFRPQGSVEDRGNELRRPGA